MITLGIETSCDETALALIETKLSGHGLQYKIISSYIHSQADLHSSFGGVFPTLAKREHSKNLFPLLVKILEDLKKYTNASKGDISNFEFDKKFQDLKSSLENKNSDLFASFFDINLLKNIPAIDRIAVTEGPGLEPALWVGITFGKLLSQLWSIPIIPINHMEGHILGSLLGHDFDNNNWNTLKPIYFPALALLISGGHTELVEINRQNDTTEYPLKYNIIGQTKDDAVGEAYDKVARLLGLPYPGGPNISRLANEAIAENIIYPSKLPRPMIGSGDFNFSFSGLKTAVLYATKDKLIDDVFKKGLAKEFEDAVEEVLVYKLKNALEKTDAKTLIVGGGVIANTRLRKAFEDIANDYSIPIYLPSKHVSGDNALMIALVGSLSEIAQDPEIKAQGTKSLNNT